MRINKKRVVFYSLLVVGLGLCIGGVFVPVLFPVGSACIVGAVAVAQNLAAQEAPQPQPLAQIHPESNPSGIDVHIPQCDDSLEVDLHIDHRYRSWRLPKSFDHPPRGPKIDDDSDSKERPSESVHRPSP